MHKVLILSLAVTGLLSCSKSSNNNPPAPPPPPPATSFAFNSMQINGKFNGFTYFNVNRTPVLQFSFSAPVDQSTVAGSVSLKSDGGATVPFTFSTSNKDSVLILQPANPLQPITKFVLAIATSLQSQAKGSLQSPISVNLTTSIDSTDKFTRITDSALLTLVQQQTFKYFWDFGHPVSGLARERNTSGDLVTTGGSGFGIMAIVTGIERKFITRADGLARINTIANFLTGKAQTYHGAFPHWLNGITGATIPFSAQDDGGDLVETAFLMQGLLTARQYFNSTTDNTEISLRNTINALWNAVDWNWYRQNNQNVLYWHWSPNNNWAMNMKISGWNEALITYVLAASSTTHSVPKAVYDNGWAGNGSMKNGNTFYGTVLPLGPNAGGPLFLSHYSFLGLDPTGLSDAYANYQTQNMAHSRINYAYCTANPGNFNGYSNQCWGLTASDDNASGYSAHSPTNDVGVISPTAAISSLPYTPTESLNALRFFYYKLGDKIWGQYGFTDAFNLNNIWFASSYLAIDQGPQIVMIENYRTGLLWNLFMSCPEIQNGLKTLGFQSPHF